MQWNHMKSFKLTTFYDLETKVKAIVIIQWKKFWNRSIFERQCKFMKSIFWEFGNSKLKIPTLQSLSIFISFSGQWILCTLLAWMRMTQEWICTLLGYDIRTMRCWVLCTWLQGTKFIHCNTQRETLCSEGR